jgi:hypothetical protein
VSGEGDTQQGRQDNYRKDEVKKPKNNDVLCRIDWECPGWDKSEVMGKANVNTTRKGQEL